ncbi:MAG: TetR/AcrR family transcriptional regulator [Candidatus Kariarchaeaceae archaeon]
MSPRLTKDQWQIAHKKILEAAEYLFAEKGYNGTSVNDIVEKSGQSKGAIYNHFENKERLFLALLDTQTNIGLKQLRELFSEKDSTVQKIKKVLDVTMDNSCDCPSETGRMQIEFMIAASRIESITKEMQNRNKTIQLFITELIDEGIKKGEFKPEIDSKSLASLLFATLEGLGLEYATLGIEFDADRLKATFMDLILKGILI